jgi:DNA-binding transcriptional regulator GbsR (MarR family)
MARPGADRVTQAQDRFIAAWGQMASAWGISRTMAEVHALLYIRGQALCTDETMDRLEISRGNASMSLRALVEWGIVARIRRRGDRKEYFVAEDDIWAMFRAVVRNRIKREVEPLLASLFEIRDLTSRGGIARAGADVPPDEVREHNHRLDAMLEFIRTIDRLGQRFVSPSGSGLARAAELLSSEA